MKPKMGSLKRSPKSISFKPGKKGRGIKSIQLEMTNDDPITRTCTHSFFSHYVFHHN